MNADVTVVLVVACLLNLITGVFAIWYREKWEDAEEECARLRDELASVELRVIDAMTRGLRSGVGDMQKRWPR